MKVTANAAFEIIIDMLYPTPHFEITEGNYSKRTTARIVCH